MSKLLGNLSNNCCLYLSVTSMLYIDLSVIWDDSCGVDASGNVGDIVHCWC